jgi:hypothetical protein
MEIYTREQWAKDRNFSARVGQEVEVEIYEQMLNCLPPLNLPPVSGYRKGFRVGEPYIHEQSKKTGEWLPHYAAFGRKNGGKCYFLGHMNKYGELSQRDMEEQK